MTEDKKNGAAARMGAPLLRVRRESVALSTSAYASSDKTVLSSVQSRISMRELKRALGNVHES
jgi:hypothetical protein